jgi:hypothetical protein
MAVHTWEPVDYADGLVRVGVQSAIPHPETGLLLRKLMIAAGLPAPPVGRVLGEEQPGNGRPTLALSLGCLQIFKPRLIDAFEMAVNYHDGYLPFYKGLAATAWSLYHREPMAKSVPKKPALKTQK